MGRLMRLVSLGSLPVVALLSEMRGWDYKYD